MSIGNIESIVSEGGQFAYDRMHFSEAIKSNGFVYCSGVIGMDGKGKVPESLEQEFHAAWEKVGVVLKEAGASYADIVEYTTYHVGLQGHIGVFSAIRDEYLNEPWPAWTAIGITELAVPNAHVEVKVVARAPG